MYIRAPTGGRRKAAQLSGLFFAPIVVFLSGFVASAEGTGMP